VDDCSIGMSFLSVMPVFDMPLSENLLRRSPPSPWGATMYLYFIVPSALQVVSAAVDAYT
jgi:hypothetical protein